MLSYKYLLSIIIPVYNVEKYIQRCIQSCLEQDIPLTDYELIIVNDGTPDNSMQIVEKYLNNEYNIKIINRENGGLSAARNTGIINSSGEYVMFLDSDDWLEKNSLSIIKKQLLFLKPDILMICAGDQIDGKMVRRQKYDNTNLLSGIEVLKDRISPCAPFSIINKNLLDKYEIRFLEGIFHEDSEFTPRLFYYAKKVSKINDIVYCVYQNPLSITRTNNPKKAYDVVDKVCPSLHSFSADKEEFFKSIIRDRISMDINTALSNFDFSNRNNVQHLNTLFFNNRFLFQDLIKASFMKYKIEGLLFSIFPSRVVQIYKLLNKLK